MAAFFNRSVDGLRQLPGATPAEDLIFGQYAHGRSLPALVCLFLSTTHLEQPSRDILPRHRGWAGRKELKIQVLSSSIRGASARIRTILTRSGEGLRLRSHQYRRINSVCKCASHALFLDDALTGHSMYCRTGRNSSRMPTSDPGLYHRGVDLECRVILAQPQGFCAGVVRAIGSWSARWRSSVRRSVARHEIVHNRHVVERPPRAWGPCSSRGLDGSRRRRDDLPAPRRGPADHRPGEGARPAVLDATLRSCPKSTSRASATWRAAASSLIGHAGHPGDGTVGRVGTTITFGLDDRGRRLLDLPAMRPSHTSRRPTQRRRRAA